MARKTGRNTEGVAMEPQAHGGALLRQKAPNHVPGPGRPPSELRAILRKSFSDRVPILESIADTGEPADQLRAVDLMGKYGLGTNKGHDEALVSQLARVTAEVFAGDERLGVLHEAWVKVIGAHIRGDDA